MAKRDKVLDKILRGSSDTNIAFADLCHLLVLLGFDERTAVITTSLQKMELLKS